MNRLIAIALTPLLLTLDLTSYAQEKIDPDNYNIEITGITTLSRKYHAKITLLSGQKLKVIIKSIGDKSIYLEKVIYRGTRSALPTTKMAIASNHIEYNNIKRIKIRGTFGETLAGFALGTLVGTVLGGLEGLTYCQDCSIEQILGHIIVFAGLGGAILGPYCAIDGPFIINIKVGGQHEGFEKFKAEMEKKETRLKKRKRR